MRLLLFFFLLLVDSAFSSNIFILTQQQHAYYSQWKSNYGKSYQSGEVEAYRLTLWVENYNRIELHNAKYRDGAASYFLAPNHFSDLPLEEIENMLFYKSLDAYDAHSTLDSSTLSDSSSDTDTTSTTDTETDENSTSDDSEDGNSHSPNSVYGICNHALFDINPETSVQHFYQGLQFNQFSPNGACANGWAIAVAQTLSVSLSNFARKTKKAQIIISVSPQQLTDCALPNGQFDGCYSGSLFYSWSYYMINGAVTVSQYQTTRKAKSCDQQATRSRSYSISSCSTVDSQSQFQLRKAVAVTPVVVQINAKAYGFIFYGGGIYDGSDCSQQVYRPNHALTVIGYDYQVDFDEEGLMRTTNYWQLMNSLGTGWGENGYIRMLRREGETGPGPCGMYKSPTFPVL